MLEVIYKNIDVSSDRIFASIDKCKYCKKGGCGVRKYNYIFYHYPSRPHKTTVSVMEFQE